MSKEEMYALALALPPSEREDLADRLLASVEEVGVDDGLVRMLDERFADAVATPELGIPAAIAVKQMREANELQRHRSTDRPR